LPHIPHIHSVTRLLCLDVLVLLAKGDGRSALRSCQAAINSGRSIGDEPLGLSQLVRINGVLAGVSTLERVLGLSQSGEAELLMMQSLLEKEAGHNGFATTVRGERAGVHMVLERMESTEVPLEEVVDKENSTWWSRRIDFLARDRIREQHPDMLPLFNR